MINKGPRWREFGWDLRDYLYFRDELKDFLVETHPEELKSFLAYKKPFIAVDFSKFSTHFYKYVIGNTPLSELILNEPRKYLSFLNDTVIDMLKEYFPEFAKKYFKSYRNPFVLRFKNLPEVFTKRVKDLTIKDLYKLVQFNLILRRKSSFKVYVKYYRYICLKCGATFFSNNPVKVCPKCKQKEIKVDFKGYGSKVGLVFEDPIEEGRTGETIYAVVKDELMDYVKDIIIPGQIYKVVGLVELFPKSSRSKEEYKFMLDVLYIEPLSFDREAYKVSDEDLNKIKKLARDPNIYDKLKKIVAPSIHGYDIIKEALVLQLFGGVKKKFGHRYRRGDIHILLIGDPGTGKSALLMEISKIAPNARYTSGKGTTAAGLTATVTRDPFLGTWAVEAGVLPLCNKGLAAIDEIDKMNKQDRVAMHTAMEQQVVTIDKANIHATLPAECSILAAANPKYGTFDENKTVAEQIDLPPTLLNRFDLIFVIKARDESLDKLKDKIDFIIRGEPDKEYIEIIKEIPISLLKKWIFYARSKVFPKVTEEAKELIYNFYIRLVNKYYTDESCPIPITPRQLETLLRLAEASARVQLRDYVTKEDAERAIRIMTYFLRTLAWDPELGAYDISKVEGGVPKTKRQRMDTVAGIIDLYSDDYPDGVPLEKILQEYAKMVKKDVKVVEGEVLEALNLLSKYGQIYEPFNGKFKLVKR